MDLLNALDDDQRQVATHLEGPLCVLAGAGTGKTRAITYRIAHGVQSAVFAPNEVLAVTFTSRAAGEMRSRLRDLGVDGVQARTFHAAALRQLGYFWPQAIGGQLPRLQESKIPLVGQAISNLGMRLDRLAVRDLTSEIEWAKVSMITADDYQRRAIAAGRQTPGGLDFTDVSAAIRAYEEVKTEQGVIDFDDVLLLMVGLLSERHDIATTVRRQYRHFVVDEYQDVNALQQSLLDLWVGNRDSVCVVGDVSQTIYSFTGATPRYLTSFTERYPAAPVVRLVRDYRSTPQVVSLANRVLTTRSGRMARGAVELVAQRPSSVPVRYQVCDDDVAEAEHVATRVRHLTERGVPLSEIAILYRTNSRSEVFENVLARNQIGYQVRGGERYFSRPEVKAAIVALRAEAKADVDDPMPDRARRAVRSVGWENEPPAGRGAVRERWDSLNTLVNLADDLYARRGASMEGLLIELADRIDAQNAPVHDGVTLASLHAAKGLEWDAVFLVGVSDGLLPISMATEPEQIAEERRLLYVGITRAREYLEISYARARNAGGRAHRGHSRFLTGIWPSEDLPLSSKKRPRLTAKDELDPADSELFELLREWRAIRAKEASKPAYTVLPDTTLVAIATAKPSTERELIMLRGIGATKLESYGAEILDLVGAYISRGK